MKKVANKKNQIQFINEKDILTASPFKSSKSEDWFIRLNMKGATEALLIGAFNNEKEATTTVEFLMS